MNAKTPKPVILCILDGWGSRVESVDNAIIQGQTPNFDRMAENYPSAHLKTSGLDVGLPQGQMGNSEVGHTNIGAGRVVLQDLPRIDKAISDSSFGEIEVLQSTIAALKATGGTCHMMGLLSSGGVHSQQDHMVALAKVFSEAGIAVAVHAFLDGRDVPPESAKGFIERFEQDIADLDRVSIASLTGRYYAMDRDQRWGRVEKAYDAMVIGAGKAAESAQTALAASYGENISDEFLAPAIIGKYQGMKDGDGLVMANFRADRAREILTALLDPDFDGFERKKKVSFCTCLGMSGYSSALDPFIATLFPSDKISDTLGEIISRKGLTQLRIAETEKYAHVTFFFNGGSEDIYAGEDRILIPSPDVATYDLKPEMSAEEVTDKLVVAITSQKYDLIVANYANPDMVGHTGDMAAAKIAVQVVDDCLGRLENAVKKADCAMLITADHGNIELMKDQKTGAPHTAHTTNLVPLILVGDGGKTALKDGSLSDLAPTILKLMGLAQPDSMTGHCLLEVTVA